MCGRAFDPFLTLAWPNAKYAVMGGAAAANTLLQIDLAARKRRGEEVDPEESKQLLAAITASYEEQQDIFYGAARGWVDRLINPEDTRQELIEALSIASTFEIEGEYKTGVLQT
jgi:acetyl-CoA carboxylase carboxyltransferase component